MSEKSQSLAKRLRGGHGVAPDDSALKTLGAEEAEIQKQLAERDILVARRIDLDQNREEKKKYSSRIYWLAVIWFSAVLLITVAHGFASEISWLPFRLPDLALVALIAGIGAGFIGVLIAVATNLFKK